MNMKHGKADGNSLVKKKKIIRIVAAIAIVLLSVVGGIGIYNTPENIISRQLNLGYKCLADGDYEAAALAFEKAIEIDEKNMEAYMGGIESYINIGDEELLLAFYDRALTVIENSEEEFLEQNMDDVTETYLFAEEVYSDVSEQAVKVLEEGWRITEKPEIKDKLTEKYLVMAEKRNEDGNYEELLNIYDQLLKLDGNDKNVLEYIETYLVEYLDFLMEEERYEEIRALAEKYKDTDIDFDKFRERIEEIENANWVDDLYHKIIAEDVDAVFSIMTAPDFIEKCEMYPHKYSSDYSLSTSDGEIVWVVTDPHYLSVSYHPEGYKYGGGYNDDGLAPAVGWGDYVFDIWDGKKSWLLRSIGYKDDGSMHEFQKNEVWQVYHM